MRRRKVLGILIGLLLVAAGLGLGAWLFPRQLLTVDSGPVKAGALVVLSGAGLERPERAVELFQQGEAPLVICSGRGDTSAYEACLIKSGVPAGDILLESQSRTTRESAKLAIAMLNARQIKSAIIVTSWYHSRRALRCFEHYAPSIKFYSRPAALRLGAPTRVTRSSVATSDPSMSSCSVTGFVTGCARFSWPMRVDGGRQKTMSVPGIDFSLRLAVIENPSAQPGVLSRRCLDRTASVGVGRGVAGARP